MLEPAVVASAPFTAETDGLDLATALLEAYREVPEPLRGHAVWVAGVDALPKLGSVSLLENIGEQSAVPVRWSGAGPPVWIMGRPVVVTERYADAGRVEIWDGWPAWVSDDYRHDERTVT